MRNWVNIDYLLTPTKETLMLQELYIGGQFELAKAIEDNSKHKAAAIVDRRIYNLFKSNQKHSKSFIVELPWYSMGHKYFASGHFHRLENGIKIKVEYGFVFKKDNFHYMNGVNPFSVGTYKVYKRKVYKLMKSMK